MDLFHLRSEYLQENLLSCSYSKALCKYMKNLLERNENEIKEKDMLFLTNLMQGIILQELTRKICASYATEGIEVENRLMQIVMNYLSKNLFKEFREKVKIDRNLIPEACGKVIKYTALSRQPRISAKQREKYFFVMIKKYFLSRESQNFSEWMNSNPEIRREILLYRFKSDIKNPIDVDIFETALQECEDFEISVFERYIKNLRYSRILQMLKNREIRVEANLLKKLREEKNPPFKITTDSTFKYERERKVF